MTPDLKQEELKPLLPCPWCESDTQKVEYGYEPDHVSGKFWCARLTCSCGAKSSYLEMFHTLNEAYAGAVRRWNRRPSPQPCGTRSSLPLDTITAAETHLSHGDVEAAKFQLGLLRTQAAHFCDARAREWRCFHCDQVFKDAAVAQAHFGKNPYMPAHCNDRLLSAAKAIRASRGLEFFVQNLFNGIDTGLVRLSTDADETLENIMAKGRRALDDLKSSSPAPSDRDVAIVSFEDFEWLLAQHTHFDKASGSRFVDARALYDALKSQPASEQGKEGSDG